MAEKQLNFSGERAVRIGVIADTHIPDRVGALHPGILTTFKDLNVDLILHAGDISSPSVIDDLQTVAPCLAARGNRDWFRLPEQKDVVNLEINNVTIALMHGHGSFFRYLLDKIPFYLKGYRFSRYPKKLVKYANTADVIVFGHTHHSENQWVGGKLFFNPGSAYEGNHNGDAATIGLIEINKNMDIKGRIINLERAKWTRYGWLMAKDKKEIENLGG